MTLIIELAIALLIVAGGFFVLVGSIGLLKLPDLMSRLHAPTKGTTLGVGSMLIASMLYFSLVAEAPSLHELVITLFLFITAPITASFIAKAYSFIAKAYLHERQPGNLSATGRPHGWATFDPPPETRSPGSMPPERRG